jgi:hypothetical protein
MKFKTSAASHDFISNVHSRVVARNQAVLGRSALFLALKEGVPSGFKVSDAQGVDLDDETVVPEELRDVVRTALNYRMGRTLDEASYRAAFRTYFEFGCYRLKQLWDEAQNDQAKFVTALLKLVGSPAGFTEVGEGRGVTLISIVDRAVTLQLLNNVEPWIINQAGHNGLLVVSGKPGKGKSQLALDLLAQVARQGVRFIFFDLKGELEENAANRRQQENRERFLDLTNARYVRLIRQGLPINPLFRDPVPTVNTQIAYEIASLIRAFAPQLGARQERVISDAYQRLNAPDFSDLATELQRAGATGVELAIVQKIRDFGIFASANDGIPPERWLQRSIVIDFKEFGTDNDTKALAVALVLNFLMKRLNENLAVKDGIQPLRMVLFVDEAHHLLPREGKAGLLGSLARQGRSWGFPVWLASQDADAFITEGNNATNFTQLAECGVHFSPETIIGGQQREVLGAAFSGELRDGEAVVRLHGKLTVGKTRQFWTDNGKVVAKK